MYHLSALNQAQIRSLQSHFGEGRREAKVISLRNNRNSSKHLSSPERASGAWLLRHQPLAHLRKSEISPKQDKLPRRQMTESMEVPPPSRPPSVAFPFYSSHPCKWAREKLRHIFISYVRTGNMIMMLDFIHLGDFFFSSWLAFFRRTNVGWKKCLLPSVSF